MKLLLINPNTTQAMTDMALVVARAVAGPGTELLAVSGSFGPAVIGSRAECALAQHSVLQLAAEHASGCDAVVLAVSLDSALWACRELLSVPVIGMTEAGLLMGCNVATRIGIVTYGRRMGPFYRELAESYGLGVRLAGVATIDVTPQASLAAPHQTHAAVLAAARRLIDHDGAEAVLLAGAAMATMAGTLQAQLDVLLLDGIACAVVLAEAQVALALPKARCGSVSPTGGRTVHGVSPQLSEVFAGRL